MQIAEYQHLMYLTSPTELLRTGDVFRISLKDISEIVKYKAILAIFEQFEADPNYSQHLWALMNQPCDLVHNPDEGRHLKTNLFLCPLQGLRFALKKGLLGDLIHYEEVRSPEKAFLDEYRRHLKQKALAETPKGANEPGKDYGLRIEALVGPAMSKLELDLKPGLGQFVDPSDVLATMIQFYASNIGLAQALQEFGQTARWKSTVTNFKAQVEAAERKNNSIILKKDADRKLANLCLNQMDSSGTFFYEPHPAIADPKHDLSYVIFLQDMLTVKIKKEAQESGALYNFLNQRRVLSLSENFSDRLLNIMGNYFSKIGTKDVRSDKIMELYRHQFKDSFFTTEDEFQAHQKRSSSVTESAMPVPETETP